MISKQVTEILKKEGLLTKNTLQELKEYEKSKAGNVLDFCFDRRISSREHLMPLLRQTHVQPVIDLTTLDLDQQTLRRLPASVCFEHLFIPFFEDSETMYVALSNPDNAELVSFITQKTGKQVVPYLAPQSVIRQFLELTFNTSAADSERHIRDLVDRAKKISHHPETMAYEVPIISLVNHLILFGLRSQASDLHLEPRDGEVQVRFRVDGLLHDMFTLPQELLAPILARLKIIARLRIDEHLRPQDGRFTFSEAGYQTAVRLSIMPTLHGQKAALRFLDTDNEQLSLDSLGLGPAHQALLSPMLAASNGLILVTGPTGSGKTTTLYAMLKAIQGRKSNIATIEDPIEYHLARANQTQVNPTVGLTFAEGLRSILRQDPDIIMVGEIRDRETATIAVNAALTGHLVLSTLHTSSAAAAIPRLLDMGIEPYLVASTLRMIVSQRLVRRICSSCQTAMVPEALPEMFQTADGAAPLETVAKGSGCPACLQTGYLGRTGIFEVMHVSDPIHDLIMERARASVLTQAAVGEGMTTLIHDGIEKVRTHQTTPDEVARVIQ